MLVVKGKCSMHGEGGGLPKAVLGRCDAMPFLPLRREDRSGALASDIRLMAPLA